MISNIKDFLKALRLFNSWPDSLVDKVASQATVVQLSEGQSLSTVLEDFNDIFIVEDGYIELIVNGGSSFSQVVRFKNCDIICYRSLFEKYGKDIDINAYKKSVLLKIRYLDIIKILSGYPQLAFDFAWYFSKIPTTVDNKNHKSCLTISLIPSGGTSDISHFAEALYQTLTYNGKTIILNSKKIENLGKSYSDLRQYIYQVQSDHKYVLFVLDSSISKIQEESIKHSDKLCFIADGDSNPQLNLIEKNIFKRDSANDKDSYLIMIRDKYSSESKVSDWIVNRTLKDRFVVRRKCNEDVGRISRILTGNALGLVLSGGGARGFAHIGLFKALKELKINIDYIGGSSVGAGLGALYASGKDCDQIYDEFYHGFVDFNSFRHYTFPYLSIYNGEKFRQVLINSYGEINIEDLLINFFCVASNLKTNNIEIYDEGKLWEKIRCSSSLPGLLPPVITERQDIIVDGGIINNLPVDVMRTKIEKSRILAVRLTAGLSSIYDNYNDMGVSKGSWLQKLFKLNKNKKKINIGDVILSSMLVSSSHHDELMMKKADYLLDINTKHFGLLQLKESKKLLDYSYELSLKYLSETLNK